MISDRGAVVDGRLIVENQTRGREALKHLFELGRRAVGAFAVAVQDQGISPGWLHIGRANLSGLVAEAKRGFPLNLEGPFEGTESIKGAVWSGAELFGSNQDDGLAMLEFGAGTLDLPMHAHQHSDRFIVVLGGHGFFYLSGDSLAEFSGRDIQSVPVRPGYALVFGHGLVHTFSAPSETLTLLSYHSPAIAFDDPRQFTIPGTMAWFPRSDGKSVSAGFD